MKKWLGLMLVLLVSNTAIVYSQDAAAPAMDPAMEAMMTKMKEYGTPSDGHQRLDAFVGKWNYTILMKMNSESPAETSQGTGENQWILDGRFLQQEVKGEYHGTPFTGLGLTGYNNMTGEYQSVWIDNMGTGMMTATGTFDVQTSAINEAGSFSCPMTGEKERAFRSAWKVVDRDRYTYEMHSRDEAGNEFKSMEIAYERAA
jgi:hypothetical protein